MSEIAVIVVQVVATKIEQMKHWCQRRRLRNHDIMKTMRPEAVIDARPITA